MGGGGGQKKIHARENAKKKSPCKEEGKEKKFMQKEGPMVTFSESLSFRNQQYKEAQQNADQRYTYAIGHFCSQWQVSIFDPSH